MQNGQPRYVERDKKINYLTVTACLAEIRGRKGGERAFERKMRPQGIFYGGNEGRGERWNRVKTTVEGEKSFPRKTYGEQKKKSIPKINYH
eukprot:COSAG06_NODE_842_length_11986_cov_54.409355_9_plen_91_part_00